MGERGDRCGIPGRFGPTSLRNHQSSRNIVNAAVIEQQVQTAIQDIIMLNETHSYYQIKSRLGQI